MHIPKTQIQPTPILRGEDAKRILEQISPSTEEAKAGAKRLDDKYKQYFKEEPIRMRSMKEKLNLTIDSDLKEVLQQESSERRISVSALITEYAMSLKATKKENKDN